MQVWRSGTRWRPLEESIRNPTADVRVRAPHAFKRTLERAITAEDYARLAERHPEVQRASASIAWNGSRRSVVVAIDPLGRIDPEPRLLQELKRFLFRYRRIGHDLEVVSATLSPATAKLPACAPPPSNCISPLMTATLPVLLKTGGATRDAVAAAGGFLQAARVAEDSRAENVSGEAERPEVLEGRSRGDLDSARQRCRRIVAQGASVGERDTRQAHPAVRLGDARAAHRTARADERADDGEVAAAAQRSAVQGQLAYVAAESKRPCARS